MRKNIIILLTAIIFSSFFTACGTQQKEAEGVTQAVSATAADKADSSPVHTLYFRDSSKSSAAVATFFNSDSGRSEDVEMKRSARTAAP